jgi:DNA polymerase III sliding clamp (beta) subunit (PCNA family)
MTTSTLTRQAITVKAGALYDLITGAAIVADSSRDANARLAAVYLTAEGGKLTAAATDRYRLIAGTIELEGGELSHSAITLHDIKRLTALIKPYTKINGATVTIEKEGYTLTITLNGDTLTIHSLDYQMPNYAHMVSDDYSPIPSVSLNLNLLASFAKVPHDIKQPTILGFTGEGKPVQIKLAHNLIKWNALLMPMPMRSK